jgi:hypothetical protein
MLPDVDSRSLVPGVHGQRSFEGANAPVIARPGCVSHVGAPRLSPRFYVSSAIREPMHVESMRLYVVYSPASAGTTTWPGAGQSDSLCVCRIGTWHGSHLAPHSARSGLCTRRSESLRARVDPTAPEPRETAVSTRAHD